jgi:hypothetical protein
VKKSQGPWKAAACVLLILGLALTWERVHAYGEPQQPAVTTAALIGHGLLQGRSLYSDLWDAHPPALYLSYAFAETLGGYGPYSLFFLNLLIAWAILGALFAIGFSYGGFAAGLGAAVLWTFISGDPSLWANQPLSEGFVNVFAAWAFFLLLRGPERSFNLRPWMGAGLLLGWASLYQLSVGGLALLLSLAWFGWDRIEGRGRFNSVKGVGWLLACVAGIWAVVFLYFLSTSRWTDFWDAVFSYNLYQLGQPGDGNESWVKWWPNTLQVGIPFLLTAFFGACRGFSSQSRPWLLLGAYGGWVFLETSCAGFTPESYQCWLPPLVIGAAWGAWELSRWIKTLRPGLAFVPLLLLFVFAFCHEWPFYQRWAVDWSRIKAQDSAVETYNLAQNLDDFLKPNETFYEFGNQTQLYYLTRRTPPSGVLTCAPLTQGPLADPLSARVAEDLNRTSPDLFLVNRGELKGNWGRNPVLLLLEKDYRLIHRIPVQGSLLFFVRNGSRLEMRLKGPR